MFPTVNLQQLTGQKSGVIFYKEENVGVICNWDSLNGVPEIWGILYPFPTSLCEKPKRSRRIIDIKRFFKRRDAKMCWDMVPPEKVVECQRRLSAGTVYDFDDVIVIAPDGWA